MHEKGMMRVRKVEIYSNFSLLFFLGKKLFDLRLKEDYFFLKRPRTKVL